MPPITDAPFKPRTLKDISVIFDKASAGATEFRKVVQSFQFQPSQTVVTATGGTPSAVFADVSATTWQLVIKFLQDAETLNSLTDYLVSNAGKQKQIDFVPFGGTGWGAIVTVTPPPLGGDMNTWLSDTITMPCIGAPGRSVDDPATPQQ